MTTPTPTPPNDGRRRPSFLSVATLAIVLLVGIVIGFAGDRLALRHRFGARAASFARAPFDASANQRRVGDRIAHQLDLTPAQRARVDSIMARNIRDIEQVRSEVRPRMREIFARTRTEMDSVLTPSQRKRLDSMFANRRRGRGRGPLDGQ
jgi:Spy/CpxP family protein refolding chaperone